MTTRMMSRGRMLLAPVGQRVTVFGTVGMENGVRSVYDDGFRPTALLRLL